MVYKKELFPPSVLGQNKSDMMMFIGVVEWMARFPCRRNDENGTSQTSCSVKWSQSGCRLAGNSRSCLSWVHSLPSHPVPTPPHQVRTLLGSELHVPAETNVKCFRHPALIDNTHAPNSNINGRSRIWIGQPLHHMSLYGLRRRVESSRLQADEETAPTDVLFLGSSPPSSASCCSFARSLLNLDSWYTYPAPAGY
jgi:hypothetical protein